jgi:hypothetical protein
MRLVNTSSRWGNLYRERYFIDGKQVTKRAYFDALSAHGGEAAREATRRHTATPYGYRVEHTF